MKIALRKLSPEDGQDIYNMLQELPANENGFINSMNNKSFSEYKQWLVSCDNDSNQIEIIDGWRVPQSTYWLIVDGIPLGYGKIRHCLTDKLLLDGGNVGYAIRPTERGRGYGKLLLAELVKECRKLNIPKVLLTIKKHNIGSIAVALANKGVVEKENNELLYIWIACSD